MNQKLFGALILIPWAFILVACSNTPTHDSGDEAPTEFTHPESATNVSNNERVNDPLDKPGMIHIQRYTGDYSISMVLDASGDNVYFEMDLPKTVDPSKIAPSTVESNTPATQSEQPVTTESKLSEKESVAEKQAAEIIDKEPANEAPNQVASASKHILYAQTYFYEKKYTRALNEAKRAIEYDPDSALAYSLKGSILYRQNNPSDARLAWEKALALDASLDDVKSMLDKI